MNIGCTAQILDKLLAEVGRLQKKFWSKEPNQDWRMQKRNGKTLGRPEGTTKSKSELLDEYKGVKSLKKGLSVCEAAKVNYVAINTVMKVKKVID